MKDHYDFTNARPNPYAKRMKNGYRIIIEHGLEGLEKYRLTPDEMAEIHEYLSESKEKTIQSTPANFSLHKPPEKR